jgi:hypothetical protein
MRVTGIGSISSILNPRSGSLTRVAGKSSSSSSSSSYEKAGRELFLYWKNDLLKEREEASSRKQSLTYYLKDHSPDKYIRFQELFAAINNS